VTETHAADGMTAQPYHTGEISVPHERGADDASYSMTAGHGCGDVCRPEHQARSYAVMTPDSL